LIWTRRVPVVGDVRRYSKFCWLPFADSYTVRTWDLPADRVERVYWLEWITVEEICVKHKYGFSWSFRGVVHRGRATQEDTRLFLKE